MKKFLFALAIVSLSSAAAMAGDSGSNPVGDAFCSDQNRAPVLLVLSRVDQEKLQAGQDASGVEALIASVRANGNLAINADMARAAGLSAAQTSELFRALTISE